MRRNVEILLKPFGIPPSPVSKSAKNFLACPLICPYLCRFVDDPVVAMKKCAPIVIDSVAGTIKQRGFIAISIVSRSKQYNLKTNPNKKSMIS